MKSLAVSMMSLMLGACVQPFTAEWGELASTVYGKESMRHLDRYETRVIAQNLNDDELGQLVEWASNLRELAIVNEWMGSGPPPTELTDAGLLHLKRAPRLERLMIYEHEKITDDGILVVLEAVPLKAVGILYCYRITTEGIEKARHLYPDCKIELVQLSPELPDPEEPPPFEQEETPNLELEDLPR